MKCGAALLIHNAHLKPVSEFRPVSVGDTHTHTEVKSDVEGSVRYLSCPSRL